MTSILSCSVVLLGRCHSPYTPLVLCYIIRAVKANLTQILSITISRGIKLAVLVSSYEDSMDPPLKSEPCAVYVHSEYLCHKCDMNHIFYSNWTELPSQ